MRMTYTKVTSLLAHRGWRSPGDPLGCTGVLKEEQSNWSAW